MKRKLLAVVFSLALLPSLLYSQKSHALVSGISIVGFGIGGGMIGLGTGLIKNNIGRAGRIALIVGGIIVAEKEVKGTPKELSREVADKCQFSDKTIRNYESDPMLHSILSELRTVDEEDAMDFLSNKDINNDTRKVLGCYYSFYNSKSA